MKSMDGRGYPGPSRGKGTRAFIKTGFLACVVGFALQVGRADDPSPPPRSTASDKKQVSSTEDKVGRGRRLFRALCAECHGFDGSGDEGPDLRDLDASDRRITKVVTKGIKGEMPSFAKKLDEESVNALIAYVRTLGADQKSREAGDRSQ